MLKSAPRDNESDPTRTKYQEGCASDMKIRTAPQREQSDTPRVTRWLRERHPNCTAQQQEQSDTPKVTRGLREHMLDVHKTLMAPRKINIEHVEDDVLPKSQALFLEVYKVLGLPRKMSPGHHGIISMSKTRMTTASTKRDVRPFQTVAQIHERLRLPKLPPKAPPISTRACQCFDNVQKAPHLPRG